MVEDFQKHRLFPIPPPFSSSSTPLWSEDGGIGVEHRLQMELHASSFFCAGFLPQAPRSSLVLPVISHPIARQARASTIITKAMTNVRNKLDTLFTPHLQNHQNHHLLPHLQNLSHLVLLKV